MLAPIILQKNQKTVILARVIHTLYNLKGDCFITVTQTGYIDVHNLKL